MDSYPAYPAAMAVRKLSISVPPDVEEAIKVAAARAGVSVSAWLSAAAAERAAREAKLAEALQAAEELVQDSEAEHGPIPDEIWQEAYAVLDRFDRALGRGEQAAG